MNVNSMYLTNQPQRRVVELQSQPEEGVVSELRVSKMTWENLHKVYGMPGEIGFIRHKIASACANHALVCFVSFFHVS